MFAFDTPCGFQSRITGVFDERRIGRHISHVSDSLKVIYTVIDVLLGARNPAGNPIGAFLKISDLLFCAVQIPKRILCVAQSSGDRIRAALNRLCGSFD